MAEERMKARGPAIRAALAAGTAAVLAAFSAPAAAAETVAYDYDARGRLISVERTGNPAAPAGPIITVYAYDSADNRVLVQTSGAPAGQKRVILIDMGGGAVAAVPVD